MMFIKHFTTLIFVAFLLFGSAVLAMPTDPDKNTDPKPTDPEPTDPKPTRRRPRSSNYALADKLRIEGELRITSEQLKHCIKHNLCIFCDEPGHKAVDCLKHCPNRRASHSPNTVTGASPSGSK
jgi:hypothetical protein